MLPKEIPSIFVAVTLSFIILIFYYLALQPFVPVLEPGIVVNELSEMSVWIIS